MTCGSCEKRRQMIAEARKQGGVKGAVKALPRIARDVVKNPPKLSDKRNG